MVKRKLEEVTFEDSSSTPRPAFKRPAYSSSASITQVPPEVSQMALNVDVDMDTGAYPVVDNQSSPSPPWSAQSNYPPNSNTLYPFPSVEDSTMECDNSHAGDVSTAHQENRPAFDPAYSRVVDNRYHSNASTVSTGSGLMQPQQDAYSHHGTHCKQIPKIRLSQYPNANGERTMWTHCEECGAIEMIQGCNGSPLSVPSS